MFLVVLRHLTNDCINCWYNGECVTVSPNTENIFGYPIEKAIINYMWVDNGLNCEISEFWN